MSEKTLENLTDELVRMSIQWAKVYEADVSQGFAKRMDKEIRDTMLYRIDSFIEFQTNVLLANICDGLENAALKPEVEKLQKAKVIKEMTRVYDILDGGSRDYESVLRFVLNEWDAMRKIVKEVNSVRFN